MSVKQTQEKVRDYGQVLVRLPKETISHLKLISKKEHRCMGAQCASIIEKHISQEAARHEQ